uniref:SH2 domain-containing protein n=1 Tax=Wuchereria bancrofti TaxID=6293 RepID=A0A1I8EGE5_WUCBA
MTNTQPEEESKSSILDDLPKKVLDESYYHGFLPREDLPCLLEQVGDFIIRITQLKPRDPCELILSLRVSDQNSPSAIRHVVIHRLKGKDGKIEWLTTQENRFNSLKELIDAYIKTSQLIRPIARQSWEFLHENIILKDMLGEGQFGEVRAGEAVIDGKKVPVAVKIVVKQIEDIIEHAYSEESETHSRLISDTHSAEKISSKDDADDLNEPSRSFISQTKRKRRKHHRRKKRHKKSRIHKKSAEIINERKKAKSRHRHMKSSHNVL